jgi:hypothetical protein
MCIDSVPRFRAAQDEGEALKANQAPRQSRLVVFAWTTFANMRPFPATAVRRSH